MSKTKWGTWEVLLGVGLERSWWLLNVSFTLFWDTQRKCLKLFRTNLKKMRKKLVQFELRTNIYRQNTRFNSEKHKVGDRGSIVESKISKKLAVDAFEYLRESFLLFLYVFIFFFYSFIFGCRRVSPSLSTGRTSCAIQLEYGYCIF